MKSEPSLARKTQHGDQVGDRVAQFASERDLLGHHRVMLLKLLHDEAASVLTVGDLGTPAPPKGTPRTVQRARRLAPLTKKIHQRGRVLRPTTITAAPAFTVTMSARSRISWPRAKRFSAS